jgi:crotonobetainyl-CoA:carnitine CoA-transferase CaiB-like acyl-CoA transferase
MSGTKDYGPQKMPVAMIDVLAAHQLKEGIMVALLEKQIHPDFSSKEVLVCLDKVGISSLVNQASNFLMTGFVPTSLGNVHPNIAPYGELFVTLDNVKFTLAIGTDLQFSKLWKYLFKSAIPEKFSSNQKRVEHRKALNELIQEKCSKKLFKELNEFCLSFNIPIGEIKTLDKIFARHQVQKLIKHEEIHGHQTKRVSSIAFELK